MQQRLNVDGPVLHEGCIYQSSLVRDIAKQGAVVKDLKFNSRSHSLIEPASMSAADGFIFATGWQGGQRKAEEVAAGFELRTSVIRMAGAKSDVISENVIAGLPYPRIPWVDGYREAPCASRREPVGLASSVQAALAAARARSVGC